MPDDGESDVLELESGSPDPSPRAQARRSTAKTYQFPIAHYCQIYGRPGDPLDRKTVERWISKGRKVENMPPLDDAGRMAGWWREVIKRKVPDVLLSLESDKKEEPPPPERVKATPGEEIESDILAMIEAATQLAAKSGLGFGAALDRVHMSERLAWAQWQITLLHPDRYSNLERTRRKSSWEDALSAMRQAEVVAEKVMKSSEEWATWEEFERELHERLVPVATGVRSLLTRVAVKVTLPPGLFDVLAPAYQREVDRLFSDLGEGGFVEALELTA